MRKSQLLGQEEEDVGRVEEGSFSSDLSLTDPELNSALMRPDALSKRQSPFGDLAFISASKAIIKFVERQVNVLFNHANQHASLCEQSLKRCPTCHSPRDQNSLGSPTQSLRPAHNQPSLGRRVILFSIPASLYLSSWLRTVLHPAAGHCTNTSTQEPQFQTIATHTLWWKSAKQEVINQFEELSESEGWGENSCARYRLLVCNGDCHNSTAASK